MHSKECKIPGKMKEARKILNKYIPRKAGWGKAQVKSLGNTIDKSNDYQHVNENLTVTTGLPETIFLAQVFHGDTNLFEVAKKKQECWQLPNGYWIYKAATHTTGAKDVESTKLKSSFEVAPVPCQINVNYNGFFLNRNPTYKNM